MQDKLRAVGLSNATGAAHSLLKLSEFEIVSRGLLHPAVWFGAGATRICKAEAVNNNKAIEAY